MIADSTNLRCKVILSHMLVWRWIKRLLGVFATLQDAAAVLQIIFPGLGAAVTIWLARAQDVPWHLVIFYSTGVLCFGALFINSIITRVEQ